MFDTNVLLAAFLTEGICAKLLSRARKRHFDLFLCPHILKEFRQVLGKKFLGTQDEIDSAEALLLEAGSVSAAPEFAAPDICRDPDDNHVLAGARAASTDYLVTGDLDLLILGHFEGIQIISPRDFEARMAD